MRADQRKESEIDWNTAFQVFNEIKEVLKYSSFKIIDVPRLEADDISFILSEYFNKHKPDDTLILLTVDQDWIHNLKFNNVEMYRVRKTQKLEVLKEEYTLNDINEKINEHCIQGDRGDGFLHIKAWSRFSQAFIEMYPDLKG
jgi:hypothetical protein